MTEERWCHYEQTATKINTEHKRSRAEAFKFSKPYLRDATVFRGCTRLANFSFRPPRLCSPSSTFLRPLHLPSPANSTLSAMSSSFSPTLSVYAAIRMDPTAMVAHLDARAVEEAQELRPKTYLILTTLVCLPLPYFTAHCSCTVTGAILTVLRR